MRTAVYTGTRNLYEYMVGAAKSLLMHSNVEQIYFLIEDDKFPYELPPNTFTINISNQQFFDPNGPNFKSEFTYMALIRVALAKIFPELDTILSLDVDTIVNENISDIWDYDITNYYFAAAKQPTNCTDTFLDINAGVMLINLKKLREDKKDDEIINYINTTYEKFPEQNAIGKLCQNYILEIPADYNYNDSTDYKHATSRKISHFAGVHEWQKYPMFKKYRDIPNDELHFNMPDKIGLDIIIPSYNDEAGLIRTLKTVYYPEFEWINIIVIDDASKVDYTEILKQFPLMNLIKLEKNGGPGNARRVGMQNTSNPFITFVDCGDIILSKYCFLAIKDELDNHRTLDIYEWCWIDSATNEAHPAYEPSTPGKIYRRAFLEAYDIYPYNIGAGSFAAEDCGINFTSYGIIEDYEDVEATEHIKFYDLPIYKTVVNKNSITFKDNKEFLYKAIPGIVDNGIYCIHLLEQAQVHKEIILNKLNLFLFDLYHHFLRCTSKRPEYLQGHWEMLRKFYFEVYQKYEKYSRNNEFQSLYLQKRLKSLKLFYDRPNIKRFINELKTQSDVPEIYYLNYLTKI